jgi:ribosomal protein L6P/L9E
MIKVTGNIEVEIKPPVIKIKSHDIEAAGRAASRLERGSLIKYRDRNKFQDGIFITKKPGKEYV